MNLSLDWIPCSKKNNLEIRQNWQTKARWIAPNARVEREEKRIRTIAKARRSQGCKLLKDYDRLLSQPEIPLANDVQMEVTLIIGKKPEGDGCQVTVSDLGTPPKRKRTGRRLDAINVPAIIADALQGVCYADDKQIVRLVVEVEYEA